MIGHKHIPSREGGIEVVVEELSTRMVKLGHSVTCFNRKGKHVSGGEIEKLKEYKGVKIKEVFTIERKGLAAMTSSLFATLSASFSNYEVIHIHAEGPAFFSFIPHLLHKKVVVTIHGECEIIRGCHNRDKGTAENERLRNPKFIFSYPENERLIFLCSRNAAQKEISTMRVG